MEEKDQSLLNNSLSFSKTLDSKQKWNKMIYSKSFNIIAQHKYRSFGEAIS